MKFLRRSLLERSIALFLFIQSGLLILINPVYALSVNVLGDFANVTVMEASGDYSAIDTNGDFNLSPRQEVSREFYQHHGDDYDFLVIFTDFDFLLPAPGAKAFFHPAKNNVEGIGLDLFDTTNLYSDDGSFLDRLEGVVDMANLDSHVLEATDPDFEKTLQALTHEMMHRWGAYLTFLDDDGENNALLGLGNAHWSFLLDSQGSSLYGNHWQDNGDGTYTSLVPEQSASESPLGRILSPLELYLMGLYEKEQVPPLTLIDSPGIDRNRLPEVGVTIPGRARAVTIDQIVAAMGERYPSANPDKTFRMAFIFLVRPDTWSDADPTSLNKLRIINKLQNEWETRFSVLTDGSALVQTSLVAADPSGSNPGLIINNATPHVAPHVNEGVNWLLAHQDPGGQWQDQVDSDQRDTAAAIAALKRFSVGRASAANGQLWLSNTTADNHDFLARKLMEMDNTNLFEIEQLQNADGGWGSAPGYRSNPGDSALVLLALTAHNSASSPVIDAAIAYLQAAQGTFGGWSNGNGLSMVQPTACALLALDSYRNNPHYSLQPTLTRGLDWLTGKQNSDGGFGSSTSAVYDSSVALLALKAAGASQLVVDNVANYLLNAQSSTGSWNNSVFQTAMAVQALYAGTIQTDLQVEDVDLAIEPFPVMSMPSDLTLSAQVWNQGNVPAANVRVTLFKGDPASGSVEGEVEVPIPGHSFVNVDFPVYIATSGEVEYFVVVDQRGLIEEASENNNLASIAFHAGVNPKVGFTVPVSSAAESLSSVVEVTLSHQWDQEVAVDLGISSESTAFAGSDYNFTPVSLVFSPGELIKTVDLNIVNDAIPEDDETLILFLSNPLNSTLGHSQTTHTILNDDVPPNVGFTIASGSAAEDAGVVSIEVELSAASPLDVSINYLVDAAASSATVGEDVLAAAGTLVISAGETSASISLTIVDDTVEEADETLVVKLLNPAQAILTVDEFRCTINDNDAAPQVVMTSPVNNETYASGPVLLQYQTNMKEEQIEVYLNGFAVQTRDGQALAIANNGAYTLRVVATNGNGVATEKLVSFVYDDSKTPPDLAWQRVGNFVRNSSHTRFDQLGFSAYGGIFVSGRNDDIQYQDSIRSFFARFDQDSNLLGTHIFPATWNLHTDLYDSLTTNDAYSLLEYFDATQQYSIKEFNPAGSQVKTLVVPSYSRLYWWQQFAKDTQGNFYVAGSTREGIAKNTTDDNGNIQLVKLSAGGTELWSQNYATNLTDTVVDIIVDGNDDLYLFGTTEGYLGTATGGNAGGKDAFVLKINAEGDLLWSRQWGTALDDEARDMALDSKGNLLLLGTTYGTFDGILPTYVQDSFLVKLDQNGNEVWFKQDHTISSPSSLAIAPKDEIVIAGGYGFYTSGVDDSCQLRWSAYDEAGDSLWGDTLASGSNRYNTNVGDLMITPKGDIYLTINWNPGYWMTSSTELRKYSSSFDLPPPVLTVDPYRYDPVEARLLLSGSRAPGAGVALRIDSLATVGAVDLSDMTRWSCPLSSLYPGIHTITVEAVGSDGGRTTREIVIDVATPTPFVAGDILQYETLLESFASASMLTELGQIYIVGQEKSADNAVQNVASWLVDTGGNMSGFVSFDTAALESGKAVAQDANGAVYLAWNSDGNAFVGKYDPDGSEVWTSDYSSRKGQREVEDVAVDTEGNVYIAGSTTTSPDRNVAHGGGKDYFLVKYDSNGVYQWSRLTGPGHPGDQTAFGLSLDSSGNVYIVGHSQEPIHGVEAESSPFIVQYDRLGALLWVDVVSTSPGVATDVVVDTVDNVYVVGETGDVNQEQQDGFLAKYSADGLQEWLETFSGLENRNDFVTSGTLDKQGNLLITGYITPISNDPVMSGSAAGYWVKYDAAGRQQWYEQFCSQLGEYPVGIHETSDNSVVVTGYVRHTSYSDLDLFVREFFAAPLTPKLVVDQGGSLIASRSFELSGQVSPGAEVSVFVDAPTNSPAIVGPVSLEPVSGMWSCQVAGLVTNTENVLTVLAVNGYGTTSETVSLYVDTLPPEFSIDDGPLMTDLPSRLFSGSIEQDASLRVVVNASSAPVVVTEPEGLWLYLVNLIEGENLITFTATDKAGNESVLSVSITRLPPPPQSISSNLAALSQGEPSNVRLTINNPKGVGSAVFVAILYDVTGDGLTLDDISVRKFYLYDGLASENPNVPGDEDGVVNGQLTTTLNYQYIHDVQTAPGRYLFMAIMDGIIKYAPFDITATSHPQTIQGYVFDSLSNPIAGARIQLLDKWGRSFGYSYADNVGHYVFNVADPGEYTLVPTARDFAYKKADLATQRLDAGQNLSVDLRMLSGNSTGAVGWLRDVETAEILTGGNYVRAENDQLLAEAYDLTHIITTTDNVFKYTLHLPAGNYELFVDTYNSRGSYTQGYLGVEGPIAPMSSVSPHLQLDRATGLACGKVLDSSMAGVAGVVLLARPENSSNHFSTAVTDVNGEYCIGLTDDEPWRIALNDKANQATGYVGNAVSGVTVGGGTASGHDLSVALIDSWIDGVIVEDGVLPVPGVPVELTNSETGYVVKGETANDGTYRFGVSAGDWHVTLSPKNLGYSSINPVSVLAISGQTIIRNFDLFLQPEMPFVNVIVQTPTDQSSQTISGHRSENAEVMVVVDTGASVGPVVSLTPTTWECLITGLVQGENILSVSSTNGVDTYQAPDVSVDYQPAQPINTIAVTGATFNSRKSLLSVDATSDSPDAELMAEYSGLIVSMTFEKLFKGKYHWSHVDTNVASAPESVTVSGPEGRVTSPVVTK